MTTDVHSPETRSYNMSQIKGKNTQPELKLRSLLHKEGFRFRVNDSRLPGKPDIVLPKYKVAIFVHGCFWHRHEGCKYCTIPKTRNDFWKDKFERTVQRDAEQQIAIAESGWLPVIIWECDIKDKPDVILKNILSVFKCRFIKITEG